MLEQVLLLDRVDDGDGDCAGEWAAAGGCAVHAGGEGFSGCVGAKHRAHGDAVGDGLGDGGNVGEDAVVVESETLFCSAKAALDLVGEKQCTSGVAELARCGEELVRDGVDAAFPLNGFDADAT